MGDTGDNPNEKGAWARPHTASQLRSPSIRPYANRSQGAPLSTPPPRPWRRPADCVRRQPSRCGDSTPPVTFPHAGPHEDQASAPGRSAAGIGSTAGVLRTTSHRSLRSTTRWSTGSTGSTRPPPTASVTPRGSWNAPSKACRAPVRVHQGLAPGRQGLRWVDTPRELAEAADIIMTSLLNDDVVESVTTGPDGLLASLGPGKVWVDLSTISPQKSRELAAQVRDDGRGAKKLDTPVSGSVPQVQAGTQSATGSIPAAPRRS
jgi:NAD binding domain of 6-phosphogluconate dehydrogenase